MFSRILTLYLAVCLMPLAPTSACQNCTKRPTTSERMDFPAGFKFGAATSAYQTEGGWDADGKGPSIWDVGLHNNPDIVSDRANGDVSGDSYHLFDKDLAVIQELGLNFYRFSISWSRILPNGDISSLNHAGVDYYNMMIDKLLANNIEPMVTMFHFDLPHELQKLGGAVNPIFVDYFASYAELLYKLFGDRVKTWMTINEPRLWCVMSYGTGILVPKIDASGVAEYMCGDNLLKAHTMAYKIYRDRYFHKQRGKVGIVLDTYTIYHKKGKDLTLDDRAMEYFVGWMANPLLSRKGDYPSVMKREIDANSRREGRPWSRLPHLNRKWIGLMKGAIDFLGVNYYTSQIGTPRSEPYNMKKPSYDQDLGLVLSADPSWPSSNQWLKSYPQGIRDMLKWIKYRYGDIPLIITENGWADEGRLDDTGRIDYLKKHLQEILHAIHIDKCNIQGYTYWSLIDSFEWLTGFSERFGLYSVDINSPGKERTPKQSAVVYKNIIQNRKL